MALALYDRVKETTTTVGTGSVTLLGASTGFQSFAVVGNANTTYYCIADQGGANWEVGIGTYTASGTTLARTTVLSSSNANALVVFTAGIKDVFVTYPSSKGLWKDASGNAIGLGTPAAFVGTNITGTASGLTAGNVTTNANLTGAVTSVGNATSLGSFTSANLATALTDETGTGANVFATSPTLVTPTLVTPALGTPSALVGTNITGTATNFTASNVTTNANLTGAVTSTGNATSLGSFTSLQLATALTDETGSGSAVFATSPTLANPTYTGTLTGSTGILNIGSGQLYKDASGNVGIGTSSPATTLDVVGSTLRLRNGLTANEFYDIGRDGSDGYLKFNGAQTTFVGYKFFNTGIERMRIDASGNVGIGTTAPNNKLTVGAPNANASSSTASFSGVNVPASNSSGMVVITSTDSIAANIGGSIGFAADAGTISGYATGCISGRRENATAGDYSSYMQFTTSSSGGSVQEKMRIDSSGNLLVGTTNSSTKCSIYNTSSNPTLDLTSTVIGNPMARFLSQVAGDVSRSVLNISKYDNNSTTSQIFAQFLINSFGIGSGQINANGANAAAFGAYSDSRLKENIVDLPSQLENILALRPVEYDYIESEGGCHQIGFIAQEVQEIYPDLVGEREDGMFTLSDMNKNDARLIKAIQELKAIIDTQQEQINSLLGK